MRPIRLKNLAETEIGQHLKLSSWHTLLHFRAAETKTHKPYYCAWPEPALARYLQQVRPMARPMLAVEPVTTALRPSGL